MRGVIFTELIEFMEDNLGFDLADSVVAGANLEAGGVFSQGGNYPFDELVKIVVSLSKKTGKDINELLTIFGEHLFVKLVGIYGKDIDKYTSTIDLVNEVEAIVHVEVKKLYPDADLPTFTIVKKDDNSLIIHYISDKKLEALAYGLMMGSAQYFNESINVKYHVISEDPHKVEFIIKKT